MSNKKLEMVKKEIGELKVMMKRGGRGYIAARKTLKKAKECLLRNKFDYCVKLLKKAGEEIRREDEVLSKVESLITDAFENGRSKKLYDLIQQKIKSGDLDSAENLLTEFESAVKQEKILREGIDEVERLIIQNLPGSNTDEAERLKSMAISKIIAGEFDEAKRLIEQAKLSAKPTPDYLLSKARNLAEKAEEYLSKKEYEKSIEMWKESIEEYERAKEAALERGDNTLVQKIDEAIRILKENIEKVEVAIDRRDMGELILNAKEIVNNAHSLFDDQKYDEAKELYERALSNYSKALELAKKRDFDEVNEIQVAMNNLKGSIESCLIAKGELLIKNSEKNLETASTKDEAWEIEKEFRNILNYLDSIRVQDEKSIEILKRRAIEGLIESMILQAEMEMRRAEELFAKGEYYDSKELYREIWSYLNKILDELTTLKTTYKKDYINTLIEACNQNITKATDILTGVRRVEVELAKVDNIIVGGRNIKLEDRNKRVAHPIEDFLTEYDRLEYIGGGGFADVYKAEKDGKVFAIKVPREGELNEKREAIFFNEVKKWEELKHRNIVKLIRPRIKPKPHLVLEYVDGGSLRERLRWGRLSVVDSCKIAFDIARALEYAHSKLIAHTDINPKNVLLTSYGEAKLTDFGLANFITGSTGIKGLTIPYSAPEQLKAKADERTDVYQLGLLLYEMLTGFNPFDGGTREETEKRIAELIPEPPSRYVEGVEELDDLIMRCLSKDPRKRPSVREFREKIYEFMKKGYGISLHLTKDYKTEARRCVELAFYAAKNNDLAKTLSELESARRKVLDSNMREHIDKLIERIKYMLRENIEVSDELLRMFEVLLKMLS